MPPIVISSPTGQCWRIEANGGERLMDVCDEAMIPIPFSCRATTCGACAVVVVRGPSGFEPPEKKEKELLSRFPIAGMRFACALRIRSVPQTLHLRIHDPTARQ
ncbi:MAG TPA: 2Fe-2S iron-sulfur cluster-binding protein [Polyangiaceae bacterium]|jgi:ferredoxin|nr:MAG: hypothetical protein BWY17_05183 [Deltaproteobacteria bacterium ADurb.Bin207]HNS96412.1 2Fe-2S iron-sulfur cluster-binding protein [Polyangiaceae bacterium]HNZ22881.1 2Fe-2S iron-sulfur cluster-binding protein [Polyangiaceae bacterium]HOD21288.1 2Fe-2S iron-sulfur cluster-binding protein [Polyangiaceae bacterium]HOE48447.1 2Fe-2S iron-sulfur cluster-binding protein [Polyangiaceae bacterium]